MGGNTAYRNTAVRLKCACFKGAQPCASLGTTKSWRTARFSLPQKPCTLDEFLFEICLSTTLPARSRFYIVTHPPSGAEGGPFPCYRSVFLSARRIFSFSCCAALISCC